MTECEHNHDFDVVDNDGETYCVECEFKRRLKGLKAELEEANFGEESITIRMENWKQIWARRGL